MNKFSIQVLLWMTFVVCAYTQVAQAQSILMIHGETREVRQILPGSVIGIEYRGYLGQTHYVKGRFVGADTLIYLMTQGKWFRSEVHVVRPTDIRGMRRYSLGRQIAQPVVRLAWAVAGLVLAGHIHNNSHISTTEAVAYSGALQAAGWAVDKLVFSDRIRHNSQQGWQFYLLPAPPKENSP